VTNLTPGQLAAIQPGPPSISNGVILHLAGLANSTNPADQVNNSTYVQYFGLLAGRVGLSQRTAQDGVSLQTQAVAMARSQRQNASGVSLDEEATRLIELQRSYQAAAQMVSIIDGLTDTLMNMLR
jgi:flagellar hook-associated protein 1 FlgK